MAVYRDHPRTGAAHVAHVVYVTGAAVAGGSGAVFGLILIAGIVGEEVFSSYYDAYDQLSRQSIGLVALALGAGLGVAAFGMAFRRTATASQLAAAATDRPDVVATWADRGDIDVADDGPFTGTYLFGFFFLGLTAFALLGMGVALQQTWRYNPESAAEATPIVVAIGAAGVVVGALLAVTVKVLAPRYRSAVAVVSSVWGSRVRARATADEQRARPAVARVDFGGGHRILLATSRVMGRISPPVIGVGLVVFFLGVFMRQPCRTCDQRYFDRPIESLIDVIVVIGGPAVVLGALLGIAGLATAWAARVIEVVILRGLARDGSPSPRPAQLLPHLTGRGPAELLGIALVAASWPLVVPLGVARGLTGDPAIGSAVVALATVGLAGVLVLAWSVPVDDSVRNTMRAAWSPGDPVPPRPPRKRRGTRDADTE